MSFPPVDCEQQKWLQVKKRLTLFSLWSPPAHSFLHHPRSIMLSHISSYLLSSWLISFISPWTLPTLRGKSIRITHRISQTVSPRLPPQAIPAVAEAVRFGEFIPRVPGVSSLSPDHSQEGQSAQVHLDTIIPKLLYSFRLQHKSHQFF